MSEKFSQDELTWNCVLSMLRMKATWLGGGKSQVISGIDKSPVVACVQPEIEYSLLHLPAL